MFIRENTTEFQPHGSPGVFSAALTVATEFAKSADRIAMGVTNRECTSANPDVCRLEGDRFGISRNTVCLSQSVGNQI